jgi:hypothetical protein
MKPLPDLQGLYSEHLRVFKGLEVSEIGYIQKIF